MAIAKCKKCGFEVGIYDSATKDIDDGNTRCVSCGSSDFHVIYSPLKKWRELKSKFVSKQFIPIGNT